MHTASNITPRIPRPIVFGDAVSVFLTAQIDYLVQSGEKTQRQIAVDCGYDAAKSNIISMFKKGVTRLPISKIGLMSAALGVDPIRLLRLVLQTYNPELWNVLDQMVGHGLLSKGEIGFLDQIRTLAGDFDVVPETKTEQAALRELVLQIVERKYGKLLRQTTKDST